MIKGDKIPRREKAVLIHKLHTGWINKGETGVLAELGFRFVFWKISTGSPCHEVLHERVDKDMIVVFMEEAKALYSTTVSYSMDKGYHLSHSRRELDSPLELNVLPKKGRWSDADRERETAPEFVAARRRHPGIESAINNLNHRGSDHISTHGEEEFVRTVALGVLAANVHRLEQIVKKQKR